MITGNCQLTPLKFARLGNGPIGVRVFELDHVADHVHRVVPVALAPVRHHVRLVNVQRDAVRLGRLRATRKT